MNELRPANCKQGLGFQYQTPAERNYDDYLQHRNVIARQAMQMHQQANPYMEMSLLDCVEYYKRGNPLWFWAV